MKTWQHKTCSLREDKKANGFKKMGSHQQRMILHASSLDNEQVSDAPTTDLINFLQLKTTGLARIPLKYELQNAFGLNFDPAHALATAMHSCQLLWDRPAQPSNFSVYFVGREQSLAASGQESLLMHITAMEGGGVTEAQITKALKQQRVIPEIVMLAAEQVKNFHGAICIMTGPDSPAPRGVKTWITHFFAHPSVYESHQAANRYFLSMVLFYINLGVQTFLRYCLRCDDIEDVDTECLNFKGAQASILNHTFQVSLPEFLLLSSKRPRDTSSLIENAMGAGSRGGGHQKAQGPVASTEAEGVKTKIQNRDAEQAWICGPVDFNKYQRHAKHVPKQDVKPCCLKWNFRGFCYAGCTRCHAINDDTKAKVKAFKPECDKPNPHFA
jgi:hypothetical protein